MCSKFPQRLKPRFAKRTYGGTEVPPFQSTTSGPFKSLLTRLVRGARMGGRGGGRRG
jgi:hypothetical protein